MFKAATRVRFRLRTQISVIDHTQPRSNLNQRLLEPGDYELEEIANPDSGSLDAVPWLVLVQEGTGIATAIGTAESTWKDHGQIITEEQGAFAA